MYVGELKRKLGETYCERAGVLKMEENGRILRISKCILFLIVSEEWEGRTASVAQTRTLWQE